MKSSLILRQHLPYASVISDSLEFARSMLSRSPVLYPFALISVRGETHCVFVPQKSQSGQHAQGAMIEDLQEQLSKQNISSSNAIALMVYCATVSQSNKQESDALVFNITDSHGHNTITIYPFKHVQTGIRIFAPYTCDFLD